MGSDGYELVQRERLDGKRVEVRLGTVDVEVKSKSWW